MEVLLCVSQVVGDDGRLLVVGRIGSSVFGDLDSGVSEVLVQNDSVQILYFLDGLFVVIQTLVHVAQSGLGSVWLGLLRRVDRLVLVGLGLQNQSVLLAFVRKEMIGTETGVVKIQISETDVVLVL